jgi:hypothetical protein
MESNKKIATLRLKKVVEGREKWRERSKGYQKEKRKLQDRNRYLKTLLRKKEAQSVQTNKELDELKKTLLSR